VRRSAKLSRQLAQIAALQALKQAGSRGELGEAKVAHAEAETALATSSEALDASARDLDAVLTYDVLDFDRWRIGRALLNDLENHRDAAAEKVVSRGNAVSNAQDAFGRECARTDRIHSVRRKFARLSTEKRDESATLEANELAALRGGKRP